MAKLSRGTGVLFGVILSLVPFWLFLYLGLHLRLQVDDYDFLALPLRIGVWETMQYWRGTWHGYYSNLLTHGLLAPWGAAVPALFSVILLTSLLAAYSWVANTVMARLHLRHYRRAIAVALAGLMVAAAINGIYAPHAFSWYASAVEHIWSVVMFLLGIALAAEAARRLRGRVQYMLAAIIAAFYAFINAGFTETYLVFQLAALALITVFIFAYPARTRRGLYLTLALAACLGSLVSLALQLSAPGFAARNAASVEFNFFRLPLQELFNLAGRSMHELLVYAGHQTGFAGFMLVAFAGLFATLSAGNRCPKDSNVRSIPSARAPIAFALVVQLLFVPILWSHQSNDLQVLGKFSYAFSVVVCINLCAILVMLALLWQRRMFTDLLNRRNGLMIYCSGVLLAVCLIFMLTQARAINDKASSYLFFTVLSLLLMLGSQLAKFADEPNLKRLFLLCAYLTASAIIVLAVFVFVEIFMVRYIDRRTLSPVIFPLMIAGLMNGVVLGALILRGFWMTKAKAVWLRWIRLFCFLVAMTIATGIVIGQGRRVSHVRMDAEIWDSQHREIIRMRDEGDPAVFTMKFKRHVMGKYDHTPIVYYFSPLTWRQKLFYGLDYEDAYS